MEALFVSFGIVFVAELGDKSQLMALTFAARNKPMPILIGITMATAVVHAFSVVVGALLGATLPTDVINVAAGVAVLGFAAWTVRGDTLDENDAARADRSARSAVLAAAGAFFLAEVRGTIRPLSPGAVEAVAS
jgi:Ca2+/H+ antiporter, TMEM165/GDT1 family